jgi:hypothetical protein
MSLTDGKSWWEENQTGARRLAAICSLVVLALAVFLLHSDIKDFLQSHSWWESLLAGLPELALAVLAYLELRHSGEANELRRQANDLRAEENRLQEMIGELEAEKAQHLGQIAHLEKERNEHLKQIAANTQRPLTQADINAELFRRYLRNKISVVEGKNNWNDTPEIVDVSNNIVTLFTPKGYNSAIASSIQVHCNDAEITEVAHGSCPLRVRINKRYGADVPLGEITRWEDRHQPSAAQTFVKGDVAFHARFTKPGSPETRTLAVFTSKDGGNSFLLETAKGERVVADNMGISKSFASFEVDYRAEGFNRTNSGTGNTQHPLFIRS